MKLQIRILIIVLFSLFSSGSLFAENDSIVFNNGNFLVGEIKSMDRGVLIFETDFSDSDFKIEWNGVREVYSARFFLITLTDGRRFNGSIYSSSPGNVLIESNEGNPVVSLNDVVYIKKVDTDFFSRLYAMVDLSLRIAKSNNLRQLSTSANFGYLADRWSADLSFGQLFSTQDEVESTKRTDGSGSFNYYLPKDWYIPATISYLSNTEQKLDHRISARLGLGNYVIHTNHSYWGFSLGASYNLESYSTETDERKSWEGFLGTELNLYDIGDLSLLTRAVVFPGLTDTKRFRSDFKFDMKYDLPLDLYIKLGATLNYDNKPAEGASETDYVIQTGLGWEL